MIASENDRVFRFENRIHRTIVTDQLLLKQLMTILFDNAVKYTEEDGEIDFLISATDRNLYLLVSDNGVGISAEDKKKIFDRFIEWTRLELVKRWLWFRIISSQANCRCLKRKHYC